MKLPFADDLPQSIRRFGRSLLGGGARREVAATLEHLAHLQYYPSADFRSSHSRLANLHNRHSGETCVIIGNGPSVKGLDLRQLSFAKTFCMNRGYRLWNESGLTPDYFVATNDAVIHQYYGEMAKLNCPLFIPWRHRRMFPKCNDATFIEMRWQRRFFSNVNSGLWPGATTTFATLQLAFHMGFSKAVLVGRRPVPKTDGTAPLEAMQNFDEFGNLSSDFFGRNARWNLPEKFQAEYTYCLAKAAYEADGRVIIDATHGGVLEVFPKMSLDAAIRAPLPSKGRPSE